MFKFASCPHGHDWKIVALGDYSISDKWIVCPFCGTRPPAKEQAPIQPLVVEPAPDQDLPPPEPPVKRGPNPFLMIAVGGILAGLAVGGIGYLLLQNSQTETEQAKRKIDEADSALRDLEKKHKDTTFQAHRDLEEEKSRAAARRQELEEQRTQAEDQRRRAQIFAGRLALDRGIRLGREGDYGPGMLWLAKSLETVPSDAKDWQSSIRTVMGGMNGPLWPRRFEFVHPNQVLAVAVSPDGKTILTGCADKTARLWDAATGNPIGQPLLHDGPVNAVAFKNDGQAILTGSSDKTARLWEFPSGKPIGKVMKHPAEVLAVAFNPEGGSILTGAKDGGARLWQLATGEVLGEQLGHGAAVVAVAFSPDGKTILTGSADKTAA
ncbi:MAG TPA: hypothetical protein VGZ25_06400, partial [Gemmataceae bacterium]|nr:hypothetical protein [Gemmataceae bacterium]